MTATLDRNKDLNDHIHQLLINAKHESIKGRYYIYEQYKRKLQMICDEFNSYEQYDPTIIELTKALKV